LLTLWNTVEDRRFEVRNFRNIEGVTRSLGLYEPELDPQALIGGAASGGDGRSILIDISAPTPLYRFTSQMERSLAMCHEVKTVGAALEKRDAEAVALLRSAHEQAVLDQVRLVRERRVEEATRQGGRAARCSRASPGPRSSSAQTAPETSKPSVLPRSGGGLRPREARCPQ
jgi:hypothetical protein